MDGYCTAAQFKRLAQIGRDAGAAIAIGGAVHAVDERARVASFIFSDEGVDRAGDRILAAGWQLGNFRQNPVALFAHNSRALPIGRALRVRVEGRRLLGDIEFPRADISDFGDQCFRMIRAGYLRACSVGFLPIQWRWAKEPERASAFAIDFLQQELVEISITPVPANPRAIVGAGAEAPKQRAQAARRRQLELLRLRHEPL